MPQCGCCCPGAGLHALGNPDALVGRAGKEETGESSDSLENGQRAPEMTNGVLRHALVPPVKPLEDRRSGDPERCGELSAGQLEELFIGPVQDVPPAEPAGHEPQEHVVRLERPVQNPASARLKSLARPRPGAAGDGEKIQ